MSLVKHTPNGNNEDQLMEEVQLPAKYNDYDEKIDTFGHGDEFAFEIDSKTQLPITRLPYEEGPILKNDLSWLKNGRNIKFSVDAANETGVLFLSSSEQQPESDEKQHDKVQSVREQKLYPFSIPSNTDNSKEYHDFLNKLFATFEPVLLNQKYKGYLPNDDDDDFKIGVLSSIQEDLKERRETLQRISNSMIENLKSLILEKSKTDPNFEEVFIFNYEELLNVLNLVNALHFSSQEEKIALFSVWVNRADIQPDEKLIEEAQSFEGEAYKNFLFWSTYMKKLILRGFFNEAIEALEGSGWEKLQSSDPNLYNLIADFKSMLESYDVVKFSSSAQDFLSWKQIMVRLRERSSTLTYENMSIATELLEVIAIMSGFSVTILENSTSWYESFFAHYLYQLPSTELIMDYVRVSVEKKPIDEGNSWESICLEAFEGKFLTMLSSLEMLDKSVAAYSAVLIEAAGLLRGYSELSETSLASTIDQMLEQLAFSYLANQELFPIGIGILVSVNNSNAREVVSEMLPSYQIRDSDDFEWALSICAKLKLSQTAVKIFRIQGANLATQGYLYEALYCYSESADYAKLTSLVWRIFENLLLEGKFEDELLISKIGGNEIRDPVLRQALSPFVLLHQFLIGRESGNPPFEKIFKLLSFKYLPKHYKTVLVLTLVPFLNKRVFSVADLVEIIRVLNEFEKDIEGSAEVAELSTAMYSLALSKVTGDEKSGFDWQSMGSLPSELSLLILKMRRELSYEISFNFLEEA